MTQTWHNSGGLHTSERLSPWRPNLVRLWQPRAQSERRGWDSNPRGLSPAGFQDRCIEPLCHPSRRALLTRLGRNSTELAVISMRGPSFGPPEQEEAPADEDPEQQSQPVKKRLHGRLKVHLAMQPGPFIAHKEDEQQGRGRSGQKQRPPQGSGYL